MLTCFEDGAAFESLDQRAFTVGHSLLGHPALSLENLGQVIPSLSKDQVFHSTGQLEKTDNFDRAHLDRKNGLSIAETIERIRTSDSYVMVRQPETDPSFKDLYRQLVDDVSTLMVRRGVGRAPVDPMLYLFIASPHSVTPFHVDRYSTLLLQFRGTKQVTVFPMFDERVVTAPELEAFMARTGERPVYRPDAEALGSTFDFAPGQALHIPFMAGHHVKNGADDVSVSLSIIFNTRQTDALSHAMRLNHRARRLGLTPTPVGRGGWRDQGKALIHRSVSRARRALAR